MTQSLRLTALLAFATLWVGMAAAPCLAQTSQTQQVMREKLRASEVLLGALVTSNWASLQKTTEFLVGVVNRPGWQVLQSPEYARQTKAFLTATQALLAAGEARDQRTALTAYNGLVASCVECHRYVARARLAGPPPATGRVQ